MSPEYLDMPAFGAMFGKSARTGERTAVEAGLTIYKMRGHSYVRASEVAAWIESQRVEPQNIRQRIQAIRDRVRARRQGAA